LGSLARSRGAPLRDSLAVELRDGDSGRATIPAASSQMSHHAALCRYLNPITDLEMLRDSNLTANQAKVAQMRAPRNSGLGGDETVLANTDIVTNLDEVVQLGSGANYCVLPAPAVYRGVGTDLDPVFHDDAELLRLLFVRLSADMEAKPVLANAGAWMDDHVASYGRVLHHAARSDARAAADLHVGSNNRVWPNGSVVCESRRRHHDRGRVDVGKAAPLRHGA